jgi:hypothetical protein
MTLGAASTTITVTNEPQAPAPVAYDEALQPLAHVYRLGDVPDNLLARTSDPTAIARGAYAGSFAWSGASLDWGDGGPLPTLPELTDRFVVEQTRGFTVPLTGTYTVQLTSDDGGWLWVNGKLVVSNPGLHDTSVPVTGTVTLAAGRHVLAFKMFERSGGAGASYSMHGPDQDSFGPVTDGLAVGAGQHRGAIFTRLDGLVLAADDMGGGGVAFLKVSVNDGIWQTYPGPVALLSGLANGVSTVRYLAVDAAGNESAERTIQITVDPNVRLNNTYLPMLMQ